MLYCDLDGVLADFDEQYYKVTGVRASKKEDNVDWDLVRASPHFYRDQPKMPGTDELWDVLRPMQPTILTGFPPSIPDAGADKIAWVKANLGVEVPVILCASRDKSLYCRPGDILIDDWEKYRSLWVAKGGLWITYHEADQVICLLKGMR